MEVTTKSMPYDAWKDNEYIEKLVKELQDSGTNVIIGSLDHLINWGRSNSIWPLTFATSCCGIEFVSLGAARFDMARFGWEVARASPRQADFIMVAGTIVHRMLRYCAVCMTSLPSLNMSLHAAVVPFPAVRSARATT